MTDHDDDFLPGQRWLSDAQSELGLGTVTGVDARQVQIRFPAAGVARTYARRNSPLVRVRFGPGDTVRDRAGHTLTVRDVDGSDGLLTYRCETLDGTRIDLPEAELDDHLRLNRPREKLLAGRIDRDAWFSLRLETWERRAAEARSPIRGLVGPRVEPVPHQLYIAAEVAGRHAPRVLLADEVGLGKTIEAGIILHRLLLAGTVRRVLVLVPEPLLHQWLVEMLRRFNLRFALFDRERVEVGGATAFLDEQRVLCALDLLVEDAGARDQAFTADWDLLIVDEAHHLHWSPEGSSPAYQVVHGLAAATPAVLLLTATPEQLGRAGHFARLHLLDPLRFADYRAFLDEERHYTPVAGLAARLVEGHPLSPGEWRLLTRYVDTPEGIASAELVARLIDRHGTGRVLFRNTRAAVSGFARRRAIPYPLPAPAAYREGDPPALASLTPEAVYVSDWTLVDPRLPWLAGLLRSLRPAKVLVICARAATVLGLREALQSREGIHAAVFHERMPIVERDRAAAYFADTEEGTQVLVCSEIGSEGRNFQFAHHLVLFDLPLDPDLLEQRIGRLDRIGQREIVTLHVPYLRDSAQEVAFGWHADGLAAFEAPCPAGSAVYRELGAELDRAVAARDTDPELTARARDLRNRLDRELEAGRDRLLELHSHRPGVSADLVRGVREQDADLALARYVTRFWDLFGVEQEPASARSVVLRPGAHMLQERFPDLPEDGLTATFDRGTALAHEDRAFLTWEHPMVLGAMGLLTDSDLGSTAVTALRRPDLKPGSVLLEAVYLAECAAPAGLAIERFLPATTVRLVLDARGEDCTAGYPHEALQGTCLTRNRKLASAVIASQAERLRKLLVRADTLAAEAAARLVVEARDALRAELRPEIERLEHLHRVSQAVRVEEMAHARALPGRLERQLEKTAVRLDALRVLVAH